MTNHLRPFALAAGVALSVSACMSDGISGPGPEETEPGYEAPVVEPFGTDEITAADVDVYIHGHPDDWQLFMGDRAYHSVAGGRGVVFVYLSAGDAGNEDRYWQSREAGADASVDFVVPAGSRACANQTVAGHSIRRCTKGPTASWYLRLPDGNGTDGTGYGRGSLTLLRDQGTATAALDGSATYASWSDLQSTLVAIVAFETGGQVLQTLRVHAPDYNRTANPGDHPDHYATADAVRAASASRGWTLTWYVDYDIRNRTVNLSTADQDIKRSEYFAYDDVMVAAGYPSSRESSWYVRWYQRTYSRVEQPPAPAAPTNLVAAAVSTSQIDLTWNDASSGETGFRIERAPDVNGSAGAYAQIASVSAGTEGFSDMGRSPGTRYWYRVRAYNGGGNSGYSNAAGATTVSITPTTPPSALTATGSSSGPKGMPNLRADLRWIPGSAGTVDVWRNGVRVATGTSNTGSYVDTFRSKPGTFTYQVCSAGGTGAGSCTNSYAVRF